jgi:hypothetical protein
MMKYLQATLNNQNLGFYHGTNVGADSPNAEAAHDILFKGYFPWVYF